MPRRAAPLPPDLDSVFTTTAAMAVGVTRRRLRGADLESPFAGVRLLREPAPFDVDDAPLARDRAVRRDVLRRARAYAGVMPRGAVFVGRTAAVIHGLPVVHGGELEVASISPARAPRARGIRGMEVSAHLLQIAQVDGLPVSTPASTWAMLARDASVRELVIAGDAAVRVPRDRYGALQPAHRLATIDDLELASTAGRRRGAAKLRAALSAIRVGSSSPLETEHRLAAVRAGLPDAALDVVIRNRTGRLLGISEFVYSQWRVVVEIEGDQHRVSRRQWDRDLEKYAAYAAEGWEVVRLSASHVRSARGVALVAAALRRHGWHPPHT